MPGRKHQQWFAAAAMLCLTSCSGAAGNGDEARGDFVASVEQRFDTLDANGDANLSDSEMRAAGPMVPGFDRDRDGRVSRAEFIAGRTRSFDRSDRNGDGVITLLERRANREARQRLERGAMPDRPVSTAAP